jgi:hypothetical protein
MAASCEGLAGDGGGAAGARAGGWCLW